MAKRLNYYQVHKNKEPQTKINKANWNAIYKVIVASTNLVNTFTKMTEAIKLSQSIPDYIKGGVYTSGNMAIEGKGNHSEIINEY